MEDRSPATLLLLGMLLLAGTAAGVLLSIDRIGDVQSIRTAPLCAGGTTDCLERLSGRMTGPDEVEERAGDRYAFIPPGADDPSGEDEAQFTGQRSDRLWDLRGRVTAAYYWNGELVGMEDPDGGGLIRSEKFSLREYVAWVGAEVVAGCLGLMALVYAFRRRKRVAGWWSARDADEPKPLGSVAPLVVLGSVAFAAGLVWIVLLMGAAWWFLALLALAVPVLVVGFLRWNRPRTSTRGASGNPAVRAARAGKRARR